MFQKVQGRVSKIREKRTEGKTRQPHVTKLIPGTALLNRANEVLYQNKIHVYTHTEQEMNKSYASTAGIGHRVQAPETQTGPAHHR